MPLGPKKKNQYCNKFNKAFKNGSYQNKSLRKHILKWGLHLFSTNKTNHVLFLSLLFIIIMCMLYSGNLYKKGNMLILILEIEKRYSLSNLIK